MECAKRSQSWLTALTVLGFFAFILIVPAEIGLNHVFLNSRVNLDGVSEETRAQIYVRQREKLGSFLASDVMTCLMAYLLTFSIFGLFVPVCVTANLPGLIVYVLLMIAMVASQCVLTGLYVTKDSVWHAKIKGELLGEMELYYKETSSNYFTESLNEAQYSYQCCGINGIEDFGDHLPPKSCCKIDVLRNEKDKCINATEKDPVFNVVGCYTRIQDNMVESRGAIVSVVAAIVLFEALEIIMAFVIVEHEFRKHCKPRKAPLKDRDCHNTPEDKITISHLSRFYPDGVKKPDDEQVYAVVKMSVPSDKSPLGHSKTYTLCSAR